MRVDKYFVLIICFSLLLVGSFSVGSTDGVTSGQVERESIWPTHGFATFVIEHLDVTSFPNSIGPRRERGKFLFRDYGFSLVRANELNAELSDVQLNGNFV